MSEGGSALDPRPDRTGEGTVDGAAVVVGLDGSETSWDAFSWACGEARRLGGRLVAVFVSRPVVSLTLAASAAAGVVCDPAAMDPGGAAQAEQLRLEAERLGRSQRMALAFVHARGDPATELLRVAGGVHADLIVVGRSTKARHRVAGSLGRHLVNEPGAPVVVVVP